jgi:hypothetical protein
MRSRILSGIVVLTAAVAAACGGGVTDPSQNTTETFTGTLASGNFDAKPFNVSKQGEYSVTLLTVTPNPPLAARFVVFLGQPTSAGCALVGTQLNQFAQVGSIALSSSIVPGTYCVQINDTNKAIATSAIYTIQVQHP